MIKFLREIRKQLFTENRFKYLSYAIGEIVLVVIGILIAIQIDNRNESIKDQQLARALLENLAENLEQNSGRLEAAIESIPHYTENNELFIDQFEKNNPYHDSLEVYFHFALMDLSRIELSSLGYETIKNAGFEIIKNDSLKNEISVFFEDTQPVFFNNLQWGQVDLVDREKFIDEHFIQKYDTIANRVRYIPFDSKSILQNHYFMALIYKTHMQRGYYVGKLKTHLRQTRRLSAIIRNELQE